MEPENIDWANIDFVFVEDETYENIEAPKWVDLSCPDELIDDEAWFCSRDCKHPKTAEDFFKPARNLKVKLLRYLSISEILPFRERNRRDVKVKGTELKPPSAAELPNRETGNSKSFRKVDEESENKNPNIPHSIPPCKTKSRKAAVNPSNEKKKKVELKTTFSASNLLGGWEILNQITEFCNELEKFVRRGSRKEAPEKSGLKDRVRERMPLIVKEGKV